MKLRTVCLSIILLAMGGCNLDSFLNPPMKHGRFMTDQEMLQNLIANYHYFDEASRLNPDENGDYELNDLLTQLDLVDITHSIWPISHSEIKLVIYTEHGNDTTYKKGYFYSENPNFEKSVWNGDLNKKPDTFDCHRFNRHIKISDDVFYSNWYIFAVAHCD